MKRRTIFFVMGFLCTAHAALFAGGKADVSLNAAQKKYPESEYVSAIGTGRDRKSAESDAKLALSQILGESIKAEQVTTQYADSTGRDEATIASVINEKAVFDHITGIVIKETVADKTTGIVHALAVLDRKQAGNFYFAKVNDANAHVASLLSKATAGKGTVESLGYLRDAQEIAADNQYNYDLLCVISPAQGRMASVSYLSPQAVRAKRTELAAALRIQIRVQGGQGTDGAQRNRVRTAFSSALTAQGATVVADDDAAATHALSAELLFAPAESPDPAYVFVRYTLNATLTEFSTSKEIPYTLTGREGHVTDAQAKNRALIKLESTVKENYLSSL